MIIAIGGRMGSGKNTVCDIIQDLCNKHNGLKFEQKAFAGKLKEIASLLTGIPVEKFEDQEFKKQEMPPEWNSFGKPVTYRYFLQALGTDALRDHLNTNVWCNALFSKYTEDSKWIITDLRFPNELKKVKEKDGITIRVERPCSYCNKLKNHAFGCKNILNTHGGLLHLSETSLDSAEFDYEIINDVGIPELIEKVRKILEKEKII